MKKFLIDYCVGCKVCQIEKKCLVGIDNKGFLYPIDGDETWLRNVCPAGGNQCRFLDKNEIWGKHVAVFYGWSSDELVRRLGSSGGVITEVAAFLLSKRIVDAVIHTVVDPNNPVRTKTIISSNRSELISGCGSRYAISSPLDILPQLDSNKKYAFIGKPCDINVLRNYVELKPELNKMICTTISFFCAGLPSHIAQNKLLTELNCTDCVSLRYRGNGWPGYTTAIDSQGIPHHLEYESSWGKILGRDIMKMCRLCMDGVGETADISCGDAWYLKEDMTPDFSEADGRNIIFARTEIGNEILTHMKKSGSIYLEKAEIDKLKYMQRFQFERRASMLAKIIALKIACKPVPHYSYRLLWRYATQGNKQLNREVFRGTLGRCIKGKF